MVRTKVHIKKYFFLSAVFLLTVMFAICFTGCHTGDSSASHSPETTEGEMGPKESGEITESKSSEEESKEPESSEDPSEEPKSSSPGLAEPENPGTDSQQYSVKKMLQLGLQYVAAGYGYDMNHRCGENGTFDCSGFVGVLLRDGLGERSIGWFSNEPWDTAYWRYWASSQPLGSRIPIGSAIYEVRLKDSYDFSEAWSVPGSIVIQCPPDNDPSNHYGHASIALGKIPYSDTNDIRLVLLEKYGVDLDGHAGGPYGFAAIYDPYGPGTGHDSWKINANGIAKATIVDNNFTSDPKWVEKISIVLVPVSE